MSDSLFDLPQANGIPIVPLPAVAEDPDPFLLPGGEPEVPKVATSGIASRGLDHRGKIRHLNEQQLSRSALAKMRTERGADVLRRLNKNDAPAALLGGMFWKAESHIVTYGGSIVRKDMLGLFDIIGVTRDGRMAGIQVTNLPGRNTHLLKWVDQGNLDNGRMVLDNLRGLLERGVLVYLALYDDRNRQKGDKWIYTYEAVGLELVDEFIGRKRPRRNTHT